MGEYLSMAEVLKLTVLSMAVVFACLLAISFMLDLLKVLLNDRVQKKAGTGEGKENGVATSAGNRNGANSSVNGQSDVNASGTKGNKTNKANGVNKANKANNADNTDKANFETIQNGENRFENQQNNTNSFEELALQENEFLVLAFTAAIAASSGKDVSSLHIHSIKKIS